MKIVFGLLATGDSVNGWPFRSYSKNLFYSKEEAEQYIPKFKEICKDSNKFDFALEDTIPLKIIVIEYELQDKTATY